MTDVALPAFEMDCREWLISTPASAGLSDEVDGAPLLAVLSTVFVSDGDFREVTGTLTVGLLDDEKPRTRPVAGAPVAVRVAGPDTGPSSVGYLLPTPDGALALLAEFALPSPDDAEMAARVEALMTSFRWA